MPTTKPKTTKEATVAISAPKMKSVTIKLVGTSPYMQSRFSQKAMQAMMSKMDGTVKKGASKVREARNYEDEFHNAMHVSTEGWIGIPAPSLRAACISACRLVGFKMTLAKLSIFVPAAGFDKVDNQGLFRIFGEPIQNEAAVRNATGVFDIRIRPLWQEWYALPTITFDEDQFSLSDVINLVKRVGVQVGLGEGRPDSRASAGLGYGTFIVETPTPADLKLLDAPFKAAKK